MLPRKPNKSLEGGSMSVKVSMKVNGKPVSADLEARTLLVTFIREQLRLTGTHVGAGAALRRPHERQGDQELLDRRHAGREHRHPHYRRRSQARRHAAPDAGRVQGEPRPAMRLL